MWGGVKRGMDMQSSIHADYVMKIKMFVYKLLHYVVTIFLFYGAWTLFRYGGFLIEKGVSYRYD